MNKKIFLTLIPMMLLCSCGSSSTSTPKVPRPSSSTGDTDSGSSEDTSNTDVITESVSVTPPSVTGATELSYEEAKEFAKDMAEYQSSDEFTLPDEVVDSIVTKGSTDVEIEGISSLDSSEKTVFSASNYYYRTDASSDSKSVKNWKYIGNNPSGGTDQYYIEASLTDDEGTYTKESVTEDDCADKLDSIRESYETANFDALTGNAVLSQIDGEDDEDESTKIDCKYYTKGAGSLIVYGTITVNNYETDIGDTSLKGSMKSAISYTWDNYIIVSGETDTKFTAKVIFKEVNGSLKTTQTVKLSTSAGDRSKPNYSNFTEKETEETGTDPEESL